MAAPRCSGDELWELATQTLDPGGGEITVAIMSEGRFKALWYKAQGGSVLTTTLHVTFADAPALSLNAERIVRETAWSEPVALSEDESHVVTGVTLRYKSLREGAPPATLRLFGQQTVAMPPSKC